FLLENKNYQPEAYLLLAELVAKVTYNASGQSAPFDSGKMNRIKRILIAILFLNFAYTVQGQDVLPDTTAVVIDSIHFSGYSLLVKARIDSVGKPMQLPYNALVQESIFKYDRRKADISKMLGLAPYYFPLFEQALKKYQLPDELKYLPIIESELDPTAISKSGAAGLWQRLAPLAGSPPAHSPVTLRGAVR
ncbi:MAG: hypothetical protein EOO62_05525, partial [Hymenobacter sp.]